MRDNVGLRETTPRSAIEFPLSTQCRPLASGSFEGSAIAEIAGQRLDVFGLASESRNANRSPE
jgi:hypothetical protein